MIGTISTSLPPIKPRVVLLLAGIAVLSVPNVILLKEAFGFMATREYVLDWWLFGEASARIGTGRMYDWGMPGQFGDVYDYRYSPLFAYVIAPFTWLGIWWWRALHVAALLLLPRRLALLLLLAWPLWFDVAHANVMTFGAVFGFLALRGSTLGTVAYVLIALLVPRPVYLPLLMWIVWKRPEWRIPVLGTAGVYAGLTLATGEGLAFLTSLTRATELMALDYNWSPTAFIGPAWFLLGVPLAIWLTWRGNVGWAGLAISPHVLPYYLLVLTWEYGHRSRFHDDVPPLLGRRRLGEQPSLPTDKASERSQAQSRRLSASNRSAWRSRSHTGNVRLGTRTSSRHRPPSAVAEWPHRVVLHGDDAQRPRTPDHVPSVGMRSACRVGLAIHAPTFARDPR